MCSPTIQAWCGITAGILSALAFLPYVVAIFKKETIPHRVTWAIWTVNCWLILYSYFTLGARETIWLAVSYAILHSLIFVLSFRYGEGGWLLLDRVCLILGLAGIACWWFTQSVFSSLVCFLLVDFTAALPTIRKIWDRPETEDHLAWIITSCGALLNLCALSTLKLGVIIYPVYILCIDGLITLLILAKRPNT